MPSFESIQHAPGEEAHDAERDDYSHKVDLTLRVRKPITRSVMTTPSRSEQTNLFCQAGKPDPRQAGDQPSAMLGRVAAAEADRAAPKAS